jgi:nucleoside phosphorylase
MAFVSDNRPSAFGNMIVVTGTVASGDTTADLSEFMSEILMAQVQATDGTATALTAAIDGTSVDFTNLGRAGRLMAIGKR